MPPLAELHHYFEAEKQGAYLAGALALVSVGFAVWLWIARSPFRAAAVPLVLIGLFELAVFVGLTARTPSQVRRLEEGFRSAPGPAAAAERARMERVLRSFRAIIVIEVVLIATGAALVFYLRTRNTTWAAIGAGLLLQGAVLLVFDLFAEHRALAYTRWLSGLAGR